MTSLISFNALAALWHHLVQAMQDFHKIQEAEGASFLRDEADDDERLSEREAAQLSWMLHPGY